MPTTTAIEFLPGTNKYQLLLPPQVIEVLGLKGEDGITLPVTHENKMQLEWLSQKILSRFNKLNEQMTANRAKLKLKKKWAAIILILAAFTAIIARLTHRNILYLYVATFAIGIIACLQLLKYFAMGFTYLGRDLSSDHEIIELKELIFKDYSFPMIGT